MATVKEAVGEQQLWASRFKKETDPIAKAYSESVTIDRLMVDHNVWGNEAHVIMLASKDIIRDEHCREILKSLQQLKADFSEKKWDLSLQEEDVQMNVERYVINGVGIENGGRMHTTRSRNDQVVLDTRLYVRDHLLSVVEQLTSFIQELLELSTLHTETLMPGYTHTQHAQPMTYAYWLTHYAAVFLRDVKRILAAYDVTDLNPLGAGALTGTSFPIDRHLTTRLLGFQAVQDHALDAVGAKDYNLEILSAFSIFFSSLSRLADEIIYGITYEYNTMVLDDGFSMGSSMMPQKKNPGVLELVRGRTGKMYGILMHMLTTMKGLPSGYNRDYHEEKTTLVESLNLTHDSIAVMRGVMRTLVIKPERMKYLVDQNFATATELANYLVRKNDIPFRLCHRIVGYVVGQLVEEGKNFTDKARTKELLAEKNIEISDEDYDKVLTPSSVIYEYTSQGGVAPKEVSRMITQMQKQNAQFIAQMNQDKTRIKTAQQETSRIVNAVLKENKNVKEAIQEVVTNSIR
ncbi:MAG: argininosuccinate lyase [Candidatus Margulisbacteria bacterium]|nr:argininosuccinate lyase [Candidatus Margulisiibacteriota bacterium]